MDISTWGLVIAVLINFGMTNVLWQESRRGPKRKFLKQLQDGKPITPKNNPPVKAGGADPIGSFIRDHDRRFFADFTKFADIMNCWLAGHKDEAEYNPWRLQELPDPILRILGPADEPAYGRRYDVFYNQIKVGDLEIKPGTTASKNRRSASHSTWIGPAGCRLVRSKI